MSVFVHRGHSIGPAPVCVFSSRLNISSPLMVPSFGPAEGGEERLLCEQFVTACLSCDVLTDTVNT